MVIDCRCNVRRSLRSREDLARPQTKMVFINLIFSSLSLGCTQSAGLLFASSSFCSSPVFHIVLSLLAACGLFLRIQCFYLSVPAPCESSRPFVHIVPALAMVCISVSSSASSLGRSGPLTHKRRTISRHAAASCPALLASFQEDTTPGHHPPAKKTRCRPPSHPRCFEGFLMRCETT